MLIPKKFMLGKHTYTVRMQGQLPRGDWGICYPEVQVVALATNPRAGLVRKNTGPKGLGTTFWHEVTHAILHDMGDARWSDEKFVTAFSKRLSQVVESAVI